MNHHEAEVRAEEFWRLAGCTEPYPRSLEPTVSWALPLAIVKLPRLWLAEIHRWLAERQIKFECQGANRPLRACLLARAGYGLVFIDGADPRDQQRMSLAHEIAHFIWDYLDPRRRALDAFGEQILPVLDGDRAPSITEQVDGALRGMALGTFHHLMVRSARGSVTQIAALQSEDRADRLALELLAPRRVVLRRLEHRGIRWRHASAFTLAQQVLVDEFGLPAPAAETYGRLLVLGSRRPRSFDEWLHV